MIYSYIFTICNSSNIFLSNVRSTLNGKKSIYKTARTWNKLQITKLNLLELVRPKPQNFILEKFALSYVGG